MCYRTLGESWQPVQESLPKIVFTDIKGPDDFVLTEVDELGEEALWDSLGLAENIDRKACLYDEF